MKLPEWKTSDEKKRDEILKTMEESEFEFFLTGSRFFYAAKRVSDIDFFTKESEEIKLFLTEIGFKPEKPGTYNKINLDVNTAVVYRNLCVGIDVQLLKQPEIKVDLQAWLELRNEKPPLKFIGNSTSAWWNAKYSQFLLERKGDKNMK